MATEDIPSLPDGGPAPPSAGLDDPIGISPPPAVPPADPTAPGAPSGDAYAVMAQMLREWGLGELIPDLVRLIQDGYTGDQLSYHLAQTEPYKRRFRGNEERRKRGLSVLSPREYLEVERSYRQILSSAGLPAGFYDSHDDFVQWIGDDKSPAEMQERVSLAVDKVNAMPDEARAYALSTFGLSDPELYAHFLDPERALPLLQRTARGVTLAGAAYRHGLTTTADRALELAASQQADNAEAAYSQVAELTGEGKRLAAIYGDEYSQADAEDEAFLGLASARRKRRKLAEREQASFSGSGGASRNALGRRRSY